MKKSHFFKIQILILLMVRSSLIYFFNFCGHFHAQKRHQKWASATSHFLTSACHKFDMRSQKEPGKRFSIKIFGKLREKSQVLEHLAKISAERACPAQSMVHHAHFSHPEKHKTSVFDGIFDFENAKNSRKKIGELLAIRRIRI